MPRYFCDYCQTYLTHDSAPGRKQHNRGWKHKENVKLYYDQYVAAFQAAQKTGAWRGVVVVVVGFDRVRACVRGVCVGGVVGLGWVVG